METFEDLSPAQYPGYVCRSLYVPGYDGTKLAVDVVRPADADGNVVEEPLPVVFMASRGGRFSDGSRPGPPGNEFNGNGALALYLVARGYVYVAAEMRGCGASFGVNDSFASRENRLDVAALIEWMTGQPWCDGNVGMMGGSNRSFIQVCTAGDVAPKGLKAITPCVSNINFYYTVYPNGVSCIPNKILSGHMGSRKLSKEEFLAMVAPVDDDPDGDLAYEAYEKDQYPNNVNFMGNLLVPNMCRDTVNERFGKRPNLELTALPHTGKFRQSGIRQHQIAGWFDASVGGQIAARNAWGGTILIGPWGHFGAIRGTYRPEKYPEETVHIAEEHKRWFDWSLKGIDNGWDREPPIRYYTIGAEPGKRWRSTDRFPLKETVYTELYLDGGPSGTVTSVNDGRLSAVKPEREEKDEYRVDLSIQMFEKKPSGETYDIYNREWDGDMTKGVDERSLTFTGEPLGEEDLREMTGFPIVELWVSSTINDGDFIAVLEEVLPDGRSRFITDGKLRASHRTIAPNEVWDAAGMPFHPGMEEDVKARLEEGLAEPVLLKFHMEPISYQFGVGSRIRLTVFCAEMATYQHPMYDPFDPPTVSLHRGGDRASRIVLPLIPANA
jgi:hypothetical protein